MRVMYAALLFVGLAVMVGCGGDSRASLMAENHSLRIENDTLRARLQRLQDLVDKQYRATRYQASTPATRPLSSNSLIEIRLLKVYNFSGAARIDACVTNKSNLFISFWHITADIDNAQGEYLGNGFAIGSNLRPGSSHTNTWSFFDVNAYDIASWKPSISGLRVRGGGGEEEDGASYFDLKEVK